MMTVGDINNVTFEKSLRGYRSEDVDDFLAKVAQDWEAMDAEREELIGERDAALNERDTATATAQQEKEAAEKKLYILAEKIEQYRADEENLKMTLLNAQRMGDTVINEAKQKAEALLYEAKTRAAQAHEEMKTQMLAEEARLSSLRKDVSKFRSDVLGMYQHHIEMISTIPSLDDKKPASAPISYSVPEIHAGAPTVKKTVAPAKEDDSAALAHKSTVLLHKEVPEVEQASFEASTSKAPIDSFENYQGINFEE